MRPSMRISRAAAVLVALGALTFGACNDPGAPPSSTSSTDYHGIYDAGSKSLVFRLEAPDGGPSAFQLVVTNLTQDPSTHEVHASVAIRNTTGEVQPGPRGVDVFGFVPQDVRPVNGACIEAECVNCPAECFYEHSGTYGDDGALGPGETSEPLEWIVYNPSDESFAFRARIEPGTAQPGDGTISGAVFHDLNGNGHREDGEAGLEGATVSLVHDTSVQTATTDARGNYAFQVAEPGLYELVWEPGRCPPSTPTRLQVLVLRRSDGTLSGFAEGDFGCFAGGDFSILVTGRVFIDHNRNGLPDMGEPGLPGVVLGGSTACPTFAPIEAHTDRRGNYGMLLPPCPPFISVALYQIDGYVFTSPNPVLFENLPPGPGPLRADFGVAPASP